VAITKTTVDAEVSTFYKRKIPTIAYKVTYDAISEIADVPEKERFTEEELIKLYNARTLANEKSKEQKIVLKAAGYEKPTLATDVLMRLDAMVKVLMSSEIYTLEQARELAAQTLKVEWPEDE
jgi:hypothetical protein